MKQIALITFVLGANAIQVFTDGKPPVKPEIPFCNYYKIDGACIEDNWPCRVPPDGVPQG